MTIPVNGFTSSDGHDEVLQTVDCTGPNVQGHYGDDDPNTVRAENLALTIRIGESSSPWGTTATCTAHFQRRDVDCSVWGCSRGEWVNSTRTFYYGPYYVDLSAPEVTAQPSRLPDVNGWYNAPFKLFTSGRDDLSGIASCTPAIDMQFDTWGGGRSVECQDRAGNRGSTTFRYKLDATPPTLAPTATPALVPLNGEAVADAGASDWVSGVDSAECNGGAPLDTSTVGTHSVLCTAQDVAGNTATANLTYQVGYVVSDFGPPVDPELRNQVTAGRSVPLKFRVTDANGVPVTGLGGDTISVRSTGFDCDLGDDTDTVTESNAGGSELEEVDDGKYQFNWKTSKSYSGSCRNLHVDVWGTPATSAEFEFTR